MRAPGAQRVPHAAARRHRACRSTAAPHAQGRHQRGHPRLGHQRARHALHHRLRRGAASRTRRIVRDFQSVIGREARAQCWSARGGCPTTVVACVGGGSNAMGIFTAFLDDRDVQLFGVEAAGEASTAASTRATLAAGHAGRAARRVQLPAAGRATARSRRPIRSPPASTIPASDRSTARSRTRPRRVPACDDERGARRVPDAGAQRRHPPGAGTAARARVCREALRAWQRAGRPGDRQSFRPRRQGHGRHRGDSLKT